MTAADEWFEKGMADIALSRSADTRSEYEDDLARAVAHFDQALALAPQHLGALREKALALSTLGDHEGALDAFVAASQLAPDDGGLQLGAAQALQRVGQVEAALAGFERVLALRPGDPEALFRRAEVLTGLRRDEQAVDAWDQVLLRGETRQVTLPGGQAVRVITGDVRRNQALLGRALCLGRLGRPEAFAEFFEAFRVLGVALGGMSSPAAFTEALKALPVARDAYRAWLALPETDLHAWQRAGNAWSAAGLLDEALDAWETVLARAPGDSRAWFSRAEVHVQRGELELALADYERSLALEPGFLGARARLAVVRAEADARRRGG